MEKIEKINLAKAQKLLCNFDKLTFDETNEYKNKETQKKLLKNIIIKTRQNIPVQYQHSKGLTYGRLYSNGGSLQNLKKNIRNTICEDIYDDIDMSKSSPTILLHLAQKYKLKLKNLDFYVKNDRKDLKQYVNSILFGGSVPENDVSIENKKFLFQLKGEIMKLYEKLVQDNKYDYILNDIDVGDNQWNIGGKLASRVYQKIEADILKLAFDFMYFEKIDTSHDVLMFDGFQHYPKGEVTTELLHKLNDYIFKQTGIPVNFVVKPFEKIIDTNDMSDENIHKMFSGDENYELMKYDFECIHSKIINSSLFLKNCSDDFVMFNEAKFKTSYRHLSYFSSKITKKGEILWTKNSFINRWLDDDNIRHYQSMQVYPPPMVCPDNVYNLWLPFEASKMNEIGDDNDAVEFFKNHCFILCNRDPVVTNIIIKWLAQMLQFPSIKTFIPTFISRQGAGKGTLLEIMSKIIGKGRIVDTPKPSQFVFGEFNGCMANAFLVCLNEMSKKEMNDAEGYFKTLITDPYIHINKKQIESFVIPSFHRFVIFSNNDDPVKTSEDDRRNFIIRCSDELCDKEKNSAYWEKMRNLIGNPKAIKSIYNYLMSIPDLQDFHRMKLPKTEYHNDILEKNEPIQTQFIKWLVAGERYKDGEIVNMKSEEMIRYFNVYRERMNIKDYDTMKAAHLLLLIKNLNINGFTKNFKKGFNLSVLDISKIRHFYGLNCSFVDENDQQVETDTF